MLPVTSWLYLLPLDPCLLIQRADVWTSPLDGYCQQFSSTLYTLHPVFKLAHSLSSNSLQVDAVPPAARRAALPCTCPPCCQVLCAWSAPASATATSLWIATVDIMICPSTLGAIRCSVALWMPLNSSPLAMLFLHLIIQNGVFFPQLPMQNSYLHCTFLVFSHQPLLSETKQVYIYIHAEINQLTSAYTSMLSRPSCMDKYISKPSPESFCNDVF